MRITSNKSQSRNLKKLPTSSSIPLNQPAASQMVGPSSKLKNLNMPIRNMPHGKLVNQMQQSISSSGAPYNESTKK